MDLDMWSESIIDGRKADFFALFAINVLLEMHSVVHLKNGVIWSTLENQPMDHNELLSTCNFHLAYMGRGLFVELTIMQHPIITVTSTKDVKAIDLCSLTYDESKMVDSIIFKVVSFGKEPDKNLENTGTTFIKDLPGPMIKSGPEEDDIIGTMQ